MSPGPYAKKISTNEGGFSQSPPFFILSRCQAMGPGSASRHSVPRRVQDTNIGIVKCLLRCFAQIRALLRMRIHLPRPPHQNRLEQHRGSHRTD